MNGAELQRLRRDMGLGRIEFGRAMGYVGSSDSILKSITQYEAGKPIPPVFARLAWLLWHIRCGVTIPTVDGHPDWPRWPTFEEDAG